MLARQRADVFCVFLLTAGALCLPGLAADHPFELPPRPAHTEPRPTEGETLAANPPCFVYPAVRSFETYVVEFSRDPGFPADATQVLAGQWMLNVPPEPLAAGRWHWRWRPGRRAESGNVWSAVRSFTVPGDLPAIPFPSIPDLVQRIGTRHPRIFVTAGQVETMRNKATEVFGAEWRAEVDQYAETAAGKELLPEPEPLPDWKHGRLEAYKETFVKYRPFFAELTQLAENYLLTGDELSGEEAKRRLLSIVAWDPDGSTSLEHNDEVGTDVVRHCPRAYDWIHPLLSEPERRKCQECFRVRMEKMYRKLTAMPFEKRPYESHAMGYYLPDLLQACLAVSGDLDVNEMLHYTLLQLWSPFYPPYGGADGGWNEGPVYWGWMARVCARTYAFVQGATGIPIHQRSNLRNQPFYKLYANPPWFKLSPFGDGQAGPARGGDSMLMLAALYHNPWAKWYGRQLDVRLSGLPALVFPTEDVSAAAPVDLPQGRCFYDVGLACSHTNLADGTTDVAFLMRSCPFGGCSHAYADQNTFVLDAFGEPLVIASGYYQLYGSKHHTQWTWQTRASNSILVNGKGQIRNWNSKGRIAEFATSAAADYIVGDAHRAYPGVLERYDRRAVFLRPRHTGGDALIVIHDEIEAAKPSTFQFLLHALDQMEINRERRTVMIRHGKAACRVDFLAPDRLDFHQDNRFTQAPVQPAANQWHLRAETTEERKTALAAVTLQPCRRGSETRLLETRLQRGMGALAVTLSGGNRRVVVLYRTDSVAQIVEARGLRTDGDAATVTFMDDQVHSAALFGGTFIQANGKPVLQYDGHQEGRK
jgi:uncharacterized protein DUF4962/heparinase II/III-like protein